MEQCLSLLVELSQLLGLRGPRVGNTGDCRCL